MRDKKSKPNRNAAVSQEHKESEGTNPNYRRNGRFVKTTRMLFHISAIRDDDLLARFAILWAKTLYFPHNVHSLSDLAKDHVFPIQPREVEMNTVVNTTCNSTNKCPVSIQGIAIAILAGITDWLLVQLQTRLSIPRLLLKGQVNQFNLKPRITYHSVFSVQMKNWDPFVLGPAFAIDKMPGPVCLRMKFSSANFSP